MDEIHSLFQNENVGSNFERSYSSSASLDVEEQRLLDRKLKEMQEFE
jgi:hypothetical protein